VQPGAHARSLLKIAEHNIERAFEHVEQLVLVAVRVRWGPGITGRTVLDDSEPAAGVATGELDHRAGAQDVMTVACVRRNKHVQHVAEVVLYCQNMTPDPGARDELALLIADLFEAAGALRRHGDQLAAVAGQTQARWQLLSVISEGEWTAPRIARRLGITRQAVQRVAKSLAEDGLLSLHPNPDHQTSVLLRPTPEGQQALEEITASARRWQTRAATELSMADLALTRRVLRTVIAATQ